MSASTAPEPGACLRMGALEDAELAHRLLRTPIDRWRRPRSVSKLGRNAAPPEVSGWGLVFPAGASPSLREALRPLSELRESRIANHRLYRDPWALQVEGPQTTARDYRDEHGDGHGGADPDKLPYYQLLIGGPEEISYDFQLDLDAVYAVGRLHFETADGRPDLEAYRRYALAVVEHETAETGRERERPRAAVFSAATDETAIRVSNGLARPVERWLRKRAASWDLSTVRNGDAEVAALAALLGSSALDLLFVAGHGAQCAPTDPRQQRLQGSLSCVDGLFTADRIPDAADLSGLVAFLFACYSCGAPARDSFTTSADEEAPVVSRKPFVSSMVRKLLGHPNRPALAVVGHVDRAWTTSFDWPAATADDPEAPTRPTTFELAFEDILDGMPVGWAMDHFGDGWMEAGHEFETSRRRVRRGEVQETSRMVRFWRLRQDLRGFALFGDPAVRLSSEVH